MMVQKTLERKVRDFYNTNSPKVVIQTGTKVECEEVLYQGKTKGGVDYEVKIKTTFRRYKK